MSSVAALHVTHPYDAASLSLTDRFIDEPRRLRLAVIGGGVAGILAGILLPAKVPGLMLTIYDKNEDFGGTWLENVYPGVRCDTPAHVYQATFAPKTDWSEPFPPGIEIRNYWQSVARKHDVYRYAKFKHRVEAASWNAHQGRWLLKILNTDTNGAACEKFDLVLTCIGRFNAWRLPDIPGIAAYRGVLRHTSNWDPSFDPRGKRVAVIGNGASGVQIVPSLQKVLWQKHKESLDDPESYVAFRKSVEDKSWRGFRSILRGSEENASLRESFMGIMRERLAKRPELRDGFAPDFSPNCRRLTPGPGYLEAIVADNVTYTQTPIRRFTATGIETRDGIHREVDAVFCATGADTAVAPQFCISANGQNLRDLWKPGGEPGFPYTYLGLATPGFPNLLFVHGPNGISASGTVPHAFETQLTYVAKLLRKVSREGIKSIDASCGAADDFVAYSDAFFKETVLTDGCNSSYNGGRPGTRIHGFWPGSAAHLAMVRREPRWEDWNYRYLSDSGNRFLWYLGNGLTKKEGDPDADMTSYLQTPERTDLRDIHESWWRIP
ncbi:flavin-binding monooxygenase-like domain-containing protein [Hirsutella rhossiliensis]|uniref:Flavin-binding monooxygenase-like domain-containing protein n=1 Tax=Hirsutella rhossiliensis TaxID=111463 RepID=A0A9P8MMQ5_9HYPO|nr:flavin-binding monooxygenase-like domain-containing protein [Hirsutella rhossiliensis]KAH0958142.1 flavin-binding monooxygenase-like domain-containing protein [Hirsutella rhossiliensis]